MIEYTEIVIRLGTATIMGGALGFNRELHGKPTGVRTFGVVALGAALVVMASTNFSSPDQGDWNAASRAIQGVITGIGFIGAGLIVRNGPTEVHGLTSAACTWLTACIGIVCGIGAWRVMLVALPLAFLILVIGGLIDVQILKRWAKSE